MLANIIPHAAPAEDCPGHGPTTIRLIPRRSSSALPGRIVGTLVILARNGVRIRSPFSGQRADGCRVWDAEDREYLDFVGGWAVGALGHAPKAVTFAFADQSPRLLHCSPGFWNPTAVQLAEALGRATGYERAFLGCTGAEANEGAIKLARKKGASRGAFRVVCTTDGFHGRCGEMLFHRSLGVRADVVTLAKGLGAGFPVSACLMDSVHDLLEPGDQGGTHTYHPLGAALGLAVLRELEDSEFLAAVRRAGLLRALDRLRVSSSVPERIGVGSLRRLP